MFSLNYHVLLAVLGETTPGSEISDRDERVLNSCINSKVSSFTQELKRHPRPFWRGMKLRS